MSRWRRRGRSRGQTLAEFALVLPVLLLLMLGLFDIGRVVIAYTGLTNGAREGARLAVVNQDTASIEQRVADQTPLSDPAVTIEFLETAPNPDPADNDPCAPIESGCVVRVQVATTIDIITPVISTILGPVPLHAETQMVVDFVCPSSIQGFQAAADCPKQP